MSYILDALQRADAERARGGVPTLHARPITSPPLKQGLSTPQRVGLALAVALALGAAGFGWWLWGSAPQANAVASVPVPVPAVKPPVQTPTPTPTSAPVPATAVSIASPPEAIAVAPIAPPKVTTPNPTPTVTATARALPAPPKGKAVAASAAAAPTTGATSPSASLAPLLSELPEATRRQIPAMTITGAVYSDNPAQRLLLVNGQVLNQGSQVAPDVTVVEIRPNSSEFNFRGTRFRMAH